MTTLRTAAQQALEFIRTMNLHGWLLADYEADMARTVEGLEAALAQEQEPGFWGRVAARQASRIKQIEAAAQQALDDLKDLHANHNITLAGTISRLEAALAQEPTPPPEARTEAEKTAYAAGWWDGLRKAQEQAEPVATMTECEACFTPDVCQLRGTCDHYAASQLRVAAQPKPPAEPVLQTCNCRWDGDVQVQQCTLHEAHIDAIHEWAERAKTAERKLAALAQEQAEPAQEPVAWVRLEAWKSGKDWPDDCFTALPAEGLTPLYTAPPKLVPLTEEEIVRIRMSLPHFVPSPDQHPYEWAIRYARAIDRAHGIGEQE